MTAVTYRSASLRNAGGRKLAGLAAAYGAIADIGPFRERIAPLAFSGSLAGDSDILGLVDHDPTKLLGRTSTQTLRLQDGARGLEFEIDVPDTVAGRDTLALAERGDLGGASIGFIVEEEARDGEIRVVRRATLLEISVVSAWPAYAETSVEARRWLPQSHHRGAYSPVPPRTPRLDALARFLETV